LASAKPGPWLARFAARRGALHPVERSGVWRYRELVHPAAADSDVVSFPEGNTPLVERSGPARWAGASRLSLKHEGMNPTASFKDRGMTVAVSQAKRIGARGVVCASTGNTSASMAAYASQAGLLGVVLVPAGKVALGKLAQTVAYGARILAVRGDFDACLKLVDQASERLGLYLANSINPFRLEGQKTIALELLEQRDWRAPDWIVLPGGNLGNTAALGKALVEAGALGLIDRMPRLAVIQAEGAAPFARSFAGGFAERRPVRAETIATAIRIGDPASWDRAVGVIRATGGMVTTVSDAEIMEAKAVIDRAGMGCEPASAASLAGTRKLIADGTIAADAEIVAILTGHVLKDPEAAMAKGAATTEIDPTVEAVERAVTEP
jgi:threonine synthase